MAQARNDETCIPAALFPNKGPDIASPFSFISPFFSIFFLYLIAKREGENEGDFFTSPLPTFWKGFISPLQHGVGGMGACVASSTAEGLVYVEMRVKITVSAGMSVRMGLVHTHKENVTLCIFDDGCM